MEVDVVVMKKNLMVVVGVQEIKTGEEREEVVKEVKEKARKEADVEEVRNIKLINFQYNQ